MNGLWYKSLKSCLSFLHSCYPWGFQLSPGSARNTLNGPPQPFPNKRRGDRGQLMLAWRVVGNKATVYSWPTCPRPAAVQTGPAKPWAATSERKAALTQAPPPSSTSRSEVDPGHLWQRVSEALTMSRNQMRWIAVNETNGRTAGCQSAPLC